MFAGYHCYLLWWAELGIQKLTGPRAEECPPPGIPKLSGHAQGPLVREAPGDPSPDRPQALLTAPDLPGRTLLAESAGSHFPRKALIHCRSGRKGLGWGGHSELQGLLAHLQERDSGFPAGPLGVLASGSD